MSDLSFAKLLTGPARTIQEFADKKSDSLDSDCDESDSEEYHPLSATVEMSEALEVRRLLLERIAAEMSTILGDAAVQDKRDARKTRKGSVKSLQIVTERATRLFQSWDDEGARLVQVSKTLQNRPDKAIDLWTRDWDPMRIDNKIEEYGDADQAVTLSDQGISNQLKSLCDTWKALHTALDSEHMIAEDSDGQPNGSDKDKLGITLAEAFVQLNRKTLLLAYTIFEVSKPGHRDSDDEEAYAAEDEDWSSADERRYEPSRSLVRGERGSLTETARATLPRGRTEGSRLVRALMLGQRSAAEAAAKAAAEAEKAAERDAARADLEDFIESDGSIATSDDVSQPKKRHKRGPKPERNAAKSQRTGAGSHSRRPCVLDSDDE